MARWPEIYGGPICKRDWLKHSQVLVEQARAGIAVEKIWTNKKSHAAPVLAALARYGGVADVWAASSKLLVERMAYLEAKHVYGDWPNIL